MERFAFKIDAALKANLYKICRLCGIDNPEKVPIENATDLDIIDLDEPSLCQKIYELVGFRVSSTDKMPQTMCSLCVDKINDFYEFREMCYATNKQTRNLLGLKQEEPTKLDDFIPIVKEEPQAPTAGRRGRKRKIPDTWPKSNLLKPPLVKKESLPSNKKLRMQQPDTGPLQIKEELLDCEGPNTKIPAKKGRKTSCSVCGEKFMSKELADEHKSQVHVPSIPRYICNACNQTHHNQGDIKAHQLWHKLSKTPYKCPLCDSNVANAHAFARHMREHTPTTPVQLLVLDRSCPKCKKTFVTNYFYNTHRCAILKRKCGGCSRSLSTEAAYMRHAPWCSKIYLQHSQHILPEVLSNESQIRIKNEVEELDLSDLPPATAMPADFVIDEEMQPMVVLERLSSPLLSASADSGRQGASKNKSSDRVSSKSYLKRVDQLLKNTMSTLVSIKHEPEVHISDTGPTEQPEVETEPQEEEDQEPPSYEDHFMTSHDDSDEEPTTSSNAAGTSENNADVPSISVKQELIDEAYEKQLGVKQEPLKLKLKITKNHGKLNSSLIDDLDEAGLASGKGTKKKKKRKHKEREKENPSDTAFNAPMVNIKQEPIDRDSASASLVPEATVMTTIPITQIGNSFNEGDQLPESVAEEEMLSENEDVKPNIQELDRLMQISNVVSGVDMAEEAMPLERAVEATPDGSTTESPPKPKSTARKSTAGAQRQPPSDSDSPLPQIVAVEGGDAVAFNVMPDIRIKAEPLYHGYSDDPPSTLEEINHNEKLEEENAYISNLDLSTVSVKQEKDLDISDEQPDSHFNGMHKATNSEDDEDGNEDSSADEAEEAMEEEEEKRIYREIELPPLEPQEELEATPPASGSSAQNLDLAEVTPRVEPPASAINLVITNICSQAEESGESSNINPEAVETDTPLVALDTATEPVDSACPEETQTQEVLTANLENSAIEDGSNGVDPPAAEDDPLPSARTPSPSHNQEESENQPIPSPPNESSEDSQKSYMNPRTEALNAESLPEIAVNSPKDSEAEALPLTCASIMENNYASDEEHQNVLNQELSEQQEQQLQLEEPIPGSDEEAENRINEHQQQLELQGVDVEDQRQPRCQENDDSNINEIAENNNNANIERELQDDALGAQENVNQ